jgi:glutamate--cysteine ligase
MEFLARDLLEAMYPIARALDAAHESDDYSAVLTLQGYKLGDPSLTPSAQVLAEMHERDIPFFAVAMDKSREWAEAFSDRPLPPEKLEAFRAESEASLERQRAVEAADDIDFETYLERYYRQYDAL